MTCTETLRALTLFSILQGTVKKLDTIVNGNTYVKFTSKLNPRPLISADLLRETEDKIVATFVDVGSIFLAYQIGVSQLGLFAGVGYGLFDAWLVVWQRERISRAIHKAGNFLRQAGPFRRRDVLPWAM